MDISKFIGESKEIINSMYTDSKAEILGYDQYLKLDTTDLYKNNKQRIEREEKEKEIYNLVDKKISSNK